MSAATFWLSYGLCSWSSAVNLLSIYLRYWQIKAVWLSCSQGLFLCSFSFLSFFNWYYDIAVFWWMKGIISIYFFKSGNSLITIMLMFMYSKWLRLFSYFSKAFSRLTLLLLYLCLWHSFTLWLIVWFHIFTWGCKYSYSILNMFYLYSRGAPYC